jgi:hypothetical protein
VAIELKQVKGRFLVSGLDSRGSDHRVLQFQGFHSLRFGLKDHYIISGPAVQRRVGGDHQRNSGRHQAVENFSKWIGHRNPSTLRGWHLSVPTPALSGKGNCDQWNPCESILERVYAVVSTTGPFSVTGVEPIRIPFRKTTKR